MNKSEFISLVTPVAELVEKKGQDYRNGPTLAEYFPFGNVSYVQMIWTKALRLKSVVSAEKVNFESMEDTVDDMIAYLVFFKAYLRNTNSEHDEHFNAFAAEVATKRNEGFSKNS